MPQNKIDDLRNHLFETMERLMDKDEPMDIARAKAVAQVGQVIINSAMAEVKAMKLIHGKQGAGSSFFPKQIDSPKK